MKTPRTRTEAAKNKNWFIKQTLQKKECSVPREILIILRDRRCWEEGLTINELIKKILSNFRVQGLKKKHLCTGTIHTAIKDINLYSGTTIISSRGLNKSTGKKEHRYYCPKTSNDFSLARGKFELDVFRSTLKIDNLEEYEEKELPLPSPSQEIKIKAREVIKNENNP